MNDCGGLLLQTTSYRGIHTVFHSCHSSRSELLAALEALKPTAVVQHSGERVCARTLLSRRCDA